jgi:hypothetical protein
MDRRQITFTLSVHTVPCTCSLCFSKSCPLSALPSTKPGPKPKPSPGPAQAHYAGWALHSDKPKPGKARPKPGLLSPAQPGTSLLTTCRGTETPYVMVSRVRRLQDLLILRPFPIGKIKCRMSEDTRREQTRHRYYHFITTSKHGSPPEQQDALKEIDIIKQKFTSHELDDILGTNIVNDQTITTPDRRPSKRRKVSVVLLFLTANRNRRRSQVQSSRSTLTS